MCKLPRLNTHTRRESRLRTNIDIDDALMTAALEASGLNTKRAVVEEGLKLLIRLRKQQQVDRLFGQLKWEGDLDSSRLDQAAS